MTAQEELARRIERDSICRAVQKKIDEGRADFSDTARYTDRAAELLGEVLAAYVPDMPTDERETLCKALLRQRYLDTNAMLNAVQRTLDAAQGLHLAPQIADYPEERVDQAAHALADETVPVETIMRRAKSAPATIARSFHDDYIEKNAAFRDSAGLKCYITRNAAAKCCDWCTKMAGRYRYGEEPEDVYRRHDNCSCTVTYENGRQRQDVWSKRTWEVPGIGAGASKPTVFSQKQAQNLQNEMGLTILPNNGTIVTDGMLRKASPSGRIEPMPKKQFRRIAKAFKLQGGVIQQNPETDEYLRNVAHAEGTTYNATTILLLQKPSRASVFEELIHTAQYRNGRNDGSTKSRFLNEIEAQEKLLRNAKYYKLTYPEIIQTQKALAQYKQDLEEYYRNGGE